ncbi:hypothetical protein BM221_000864 [Beauveria bassiana]|uniref:Uncharacterized protein n=1 Tax=Beauveria bassiana TaxID=176275 RepID=A0A2N6P1N6_BEABA|nr:hypothetical protein BM221_000864 [Beauveria bassiana]
MWYRRVLDTVGSGKAADGSSGGEEGRGGTVTTRTARPDIRHEDEWRGAVALAAFGLDSVNHIPASQVPS